MRILVGTMHTIEQEFGDCVAAIRAQKGVEFEHFILENLPHKQAHERLYGTFMERAGEFDVFVKIDADMVLARDSVLGEIGEFFSARGDVDRLTVAVHDFFPDALVSGLHSWRSGVTWPARPEVFVDQDPVPAERVVTDYVNLAPAAHHCPNPSGLQCFHYGMIRAVKVVAGLSEGWLNALCLGLVDDTWKHFRRYADTRLVLACLGAELAFAGRFGGGDLDYSSPRVEAAYRRAESMTTGELTGAATRMRLLNRLLHPALLAGESGLPGFLGRCALSARGRTAAAPKRGTSASLR